MLVYRLVPKGVLITHHVVLKGDMLKSMLISVAMAPLMHAAMQINLKHVLDAWEHDNNYVRVTKQGVNVN